MLFTQQHTARRTHARQPTHTVHKCRERTARNQTGKATCTRIIYAVKTARATADNSMHSYCCRRPDKQQQGSEGGKSQRYKKRLNGRSRHNRTKIERAEEDQCQHAALLSPQSTPACLLLQWFIFTQRKPPAQTAAAAAFIRCRCLPSCPSSSATGNTRQRRRTCRHTASASR